MVRVLRSVHVPSITTVRRSAGDRPRAAEDAGVSWPASNRALPAKGRLGKPCVGRRRIRGSTDQRVIRQHDGLAKVTVWLRANNFSWISAAENGSTLAAGSSSMKQSVSESSPLAIARRCRIPLESAVGRVAPWFSNPTDSSASPGPDPPAFRADTSPSRPGDGHCTGRTPRRVWLPFSLAVRHTIRRSRYRSRFAATVPRAPCRTAGTPHELADYLWSQSPPQTSGSECNLLALLRRRS